MLCEKVKFACKVFRTEYAQIPGYPPGKDHCIKLNVPYVPYALFLN